MSHSELPFIYEYTEPQVRVFSEGESGLPHLDDDNTPQESVIHDLE